MALYNNDARKKQKKTVAVDNGGDSSLSIPVVVIPPALSFGNILKEFPDFLFCLLRYVADRVVWNSIASSNKDIHAKSKAILPPWPLYYKLPSADFSELIMAWSIYGTRIAYARNSKIAIVDQQRGPLRRWQATPDDVDEDIITDLKYSPDGRFLVSAGNDGFIRLWDTTRNYEQLQELNMREEVGEVLLGASSISISTCSKYMVVSMGTYSFLLDVENRGKTIKSLMPPFSPRLRIDNIQFSSDDRAVFMCRNKMIQVWRPHLDADDEDHLITVWRKTDLGRGFRIFTFSHDNSMVVIHNVWTNIGVLWSIDTDHKCLTKKFDFHRSTGFHFTPDGKYIVANKENGPTLWCIAEGKYTNNTLHLLDNGTTATQNLAVVENFSPNNRQCIVQASSGDRYISSYFVK